MKAEWQVGKWPEKDKAFYSSPDRCDKFSWKCYQFCKIYYPLKGYELLAKSDHHNTYESRWIQMKNLPCSMSQHPANLSTCRTGRGTHNYTPITGLMRTLLVNDPIITSTRLIPERERERTKVSTLSYHNIKWNVG